MHVSAYTQDEIMQLESALAEVAKAHHPVLQEGSDADHVAVKIAELGLSLKKAAKQVLALNSKE